MRHLLFLPLLFSAASCFAIDDCGDNEGSSYYLGCMAEHRGKNAQKMVDDSYRKLLADYEKQGQIKQRNLLIESQNAWEKYKLAKCQLEQESAGGANGMNYAQCNEIETRVRLDDLRSLLGLEKYEGDL